MSDGSATGDSDARTPDDIPVSFAHFVVSLGSSALVSLGETADPTSGQVQVNLGLARNTIDVLAILKDKTAGNLDDDESKLLDALLFDLRQKYIAAKSG